MIYFLTHTRSRLPNHIIHCLRQLLFVEPDSKIVLCTDSNIRFDDHRITVINSNDLITPDIGDYFRYEPDPLWIASLQRIFYLNSFIQKTDDDVVSFDNDTLLYHPLGNIVNNLTKGVHITPQKPTEHIFGCCIIKDKDKFNNITNSIYNAVIRGKQFVLSQTGDQAHEMRLLNYYGKQYINDLPVHPALGNIDHMIFDPITYGQYFGGTHGGAPPGFIDREHIAGRLLDERSKLSIIDNEPVINYNNETFKLINLHVHSKNLELLASYNKSSKKIKKDYCVVTFGKGYNFERGVARLKQQCEELFIPFLGFTEYPTGCPTHEESPFAFKFFCIQEALKYGYKKILWLDTSVIIKRQINDIFERINDVGYFILYNHDLGSFCSDKALKTLNITREESFNLPCMQGTNFGLNFTHANVRRFFDKIIQLATDGITFPGPHNNNNFKASKDIRVKGHRHDQTAMSVIALRCGMTDWIGGGELPWFIHDREFVKTVDGIFNESTVVDIDMSE